MPADIVHLIGFPGIGKLTIAKEIVRQRPEFVLVDNHLINNPIFSVVKADGRTPLHRDVWIKIAQIKDIVLDTMARLSPPHLSFVMTNFLIEDEADKAECRRIETIAERRRGLYFPVVLTCDLEENRRRIVSPERRLSLKSVDPGAPDRLHAGKPPLRYDGHPNRVEIDVTSAQPTETATQILRVVDRAPARSPAAAATDTPWQPPISK